MANYQLKINYFDIYPKNVIIITNENLYTFNELIELIKKHTKLDYRSIISSYMTLKVNNSYIDIYKEDIILGRKNKLKISPLKDFDKITENFIDLRLLIPRNLIDDVRFYIENIDYALEELKIELGINYGSELLSRKKIIEVITSNGYLIYPTLFYDNNYLINFFINIQNSQATSIIIDLIYYAFKIDISNGILKLSKSRLITDLIRINAIFIKCIKKLIDENSNLITPNLIQYIVINLDENDTINDIIKSNNFIKLAVEKKFSIIKTLYNFYLENDIDIIDILSHYGKNYNDLIE